MKQSDEEDSYHFQQMYLGVDATLVHKKLVFFMNVYNFIVFRILLSLGVTCRNTGVSALHFKNSCKRSTC